MLSLAAVLLFIMIIQVELSGNVGGISMLSPQQVVNLINRSHAIVFDVRNKQSFKDGHITDAVSVDSEQLGSPSKKIQKFKTKPIIIACDQGMQAPKFAKQLRSQGFETVYGIKGGMKAWQQDNLPLIQS